MDLSVIIVTLNNKKILEECINSINAHTRAVSFEIIVVDNNSADGTQQLIKARYPGAALIENNENLGFSKANNQGLKTAKGRYVLVLNDDTYVKDDSFSKLVVFMDDNPEIGICGPKLLNIDGSIQRQGSILSARKWLSKNPTEVSLIIGACMLIRRSVLDRIGFFDENIFFYNDDLDLCKRARSAGFKVVYSPIAEVYHYGGYSTKKSQDQAMLVEGFRGGLYYCRKHYGAFVYSIYRISLLFLALIMIPLSIHKKERLKAYIEVLKMIITGKIIYKTGTL